MSKITLNMIEQVNDELELLIERPKFITGLDQITRSLLRSGLSLTETPEEVAKLKSALNKLSSDIPRGNGAMFDSAGNVEVGYWLGVIWAIRSLDWESGKQIAREWSQRCPARYGDGSGFDQAWRGYNEDHTQPVRIGSLYKLAKTKGWSFEESPILYAAAANAEHYKLLGRDEIFALAPILWRVKHLLPVTGLAAIYGPSGSGKSFLCLDLAISIALGKHWFGNRTVSSNVVYVMLEGESGLRNRIAAWEKQNNQQLPQNMRCVTQPFKLVAVENILKMAASIPKHAVVFIDTLNRAAPQVDENSSKEMGEILEGCKRLQTLTCGLVVVVHHTGKDQAKGLRGHSSLHAALDAAIAVEVSAVGKAWSVAKSKDSEDGRKTAFQLKRHSLGVDEDGDEISSCTVEPDISAAFRKPEPTGKQQKAALELLRNIIKSSSNRGVAGCPSGSGCVTVHEAVSGVASILTTTEKNKRNNRAKQIIDGLIAGGFLDSGLDGGEGVVWNPQ